MIGGAGLPPVGRVLSEARSYAERLFSIRPVGALSPEDTRAAFEEPAAELEVAFEPAALDQLVEVSGGYPFFIQSYGKHVWDVADGSPIAADDVELSLPRAYRELVDSFFRPRYDRATPAERRYMHAMADLGEGDVSSTDVAAALGHDQPSRVSPQRDGLLTKGLIYAPERGLLAFTVRTWSATSASSPSDRDPSAGSPVDVRRPARRDHGDRARHGASATSFAVKVDDAAAAQRLDLLQHPGGPEQRGRLVPRGR